MCTLLSSKINYLKSISIIIIRCKFSLIFHYNRNLHNGIVIVLRNIIPVHKIASLAQLAYTAILEKIDDVLGPLRLL